MASVDNLDNAVQDSTDSGWYPLTSFAFMLRVELAFDLPCRAIRGLRRENEFDYIQEGGLNDYVHMKRKPISRPFTFQVERYVGLDYLDPLPLGVELTLPVLLFVNPYPFRNSSFFKPVRSYAFLGCTVTAKDYGELNAESSGLLVETTTIAFREMACIDLPSKWLNKNSWNFAMGQDKKIAYEGQGESNKNTRDANLSAASKRSKKEMEEKAAEQLWAFDKKAKEGNKKRRYLTNSNETNMSGTEPTADEMSAKAKLWPEKASAVKNKMKTPKAGLWSFDKDTKKKAGNGTRRYLHEANGTNTPGVEATKEQMNEKAQLWAFDEKKKAGNDKRAYLHKENGTNTPSAEKSMEQMQKNASIWPPKESAKKGEMKTPQARSGGAVKNEMKTPQARSGGAVKNEMKTPQARSGGAVKNEMKTPAARLWPKEASAVQSPSSKAESRKWPDETSAQKAHTSKRKKQSSSSSARKSSSSKAKSRVWPKTSSAQTAQSAKIKGAGRTSSGGPGRKTSSSPRAGGR